MQVRIYIKYQINDINMKNFMFMVMVSLSANLFACILNFNEIPNENISQLDKMGLEDSPLLNEFESDYFNVVYKDSLNGFNFSEKKIGFIHRGAKSDKKEYFELEKKRFKHGETPNYGTLYVFDETQKEESGGYDAVIVYWSKVNYSKEQIIKKIKGKSCKKKH